MWRAGFLLFTALGALSLLREKSPIAGKEGGMDGLNASKYLELGRIGLVS